VPIQRNPVAAHRRVILFHHGVGCVPAACEALALRGIEVRAATDFQELAAWLVCWRGSAIAVVQLPPLDTFQATTLAAMRRIDPTIAIAALTPGSTSDQIADEAMQLLAAGRSAAIDEDLPEREAA
jgi:hypothetical protein